MTLVTLEHRPPYQCMIWPLTDEKSLGTLPIAAHAARAFITETLTCWRMSGMADTAKLVATELVTNAVKASWPLDAAKPVRLWLWSDGRSLVIEVYDGAPGYPQPSPRDEGGWGLSIVASLCASWGVYPDRRGKVVWALLAGA
jgi:hypothetical protein